jgi:hypothetical protein
LVSDIQAGDGKINNLFYSVCRLDLHVGGWVVEGSVNQCTWCGEITGSSGCMNESLGGVGVGGVQTIPMVFHHGSMNGLKGPSTDADA